MADLRKELDEVRAAYAELRAAVLARQHAVAELVSLYRERELARARAAKRDPNAALN
jgi:ribosomal protein L29